MDCFDPFQLYFIYHNHFLAIIGLRVVSEDKIFMGIIMVLTISSSSAKTKSYADNATQKIMAVTPSKQWIHFFLSDLCPPTSNILENESYKLVTMIMSHTLNIAHTEMTLRKSRWVARWQSARCIVHFVQYIKWYLLMHLFSCVWSK